MGARMHACIAAFSSGVPVLPIAYSRKFSGLFGSLGYRYLVDCREDTDDEATAKVLEFLEHVDQVREELGQSRARAAVALDRYQSALVELLAPLESRKVAAR
jgi:polysaccharide pyruvyl transferase WcaK-like protein